jgi:hypothetical protein
MFILSFLILALLLFSLPAFKQEMFNRRVLKAADRTFEYLNLDRALVLSDRFNASNCLVNIPYIGVIIVDGSLVPWGNRKWEVICCKPIPLDLQKNCILTRETFTLQEYHFATNLFREIYWGLMVTEGSKHDEQLLLKALKKALMKVYDKYQ